MHNGPDLNEQIIAVLSCSMSPPPVLKSRVMESFPVDTWRLGWQQSGFPGKKWHQRVVTFHVILSYTPSLTPSVLSILFGNVASFDLQDAIIQTLICAF